MPQFLGRATIRANGQVIETAKGASLDVGGTKRNPVTVGRVVGWAEESVPAMVECDTGQRYVINDAFLTDTPTMKDGEGGNITLKFSGPSAEEVL